MIAKREPKLCYIGTKVCKKKVTFFHMLLNKLLKFNFELFCCSFKMLRRSLKNIGFCLCYDNALVVSYDKNLCRVIFLRQNKSFLTVKLF